MLEIAGQRTMMPGAAIQCPGPVTVVDGEDIAALQQTCGTPYPGQRSEIDFCSPSIAKLRPRYFIAIQVGSHLRRTRFAQNFTQASILHIDIYFIELCMLCLHDMHRKSIDQFI